MRQETLALSSPRTLVTRNELYALLCRAAWKLLSRNIVIITKSSNGNISPLLAICAGNSQVPGEFTAQRPMTRTFDIFFDLRLNQWLRKQSWSWWFETLPRPLLRQCNDYVKFGASRQKTFESSYHATDLKITYGSQINNTKYTDVVFTSTTVTFFGEKKQQITGERSNSTWPEEMK